MHTIGLLGGMSYMSTLTYYEQINAQVAAQLGGLHSAKIILHSVNFAEIELLQRTNQWQQAGELLAHHAQQLERAGADCVALCTNTMHKIAPQMEATITIPLIHIASAVASCLHQKGIHKVALLGTKYTMQQDFYKDKLNQAGIQLVLPSERAMQEVNRIIFEELCLGKVEEKSQQYASVLLEQLQSQGAQGVLLGCTELGMLSHGLECSIPLLDTTLIHCEALVNFALRG
jgi:aspartate racemase